MDSKNLDYYLSNPDELADLSDEQIEALAENQGAATEDRAANNGDTESAVTPDSTAEVQDVAPDSTAEVQEGKKPDGILARDGKHIIPFSRLEEAERRARDYARKLEELQKAQATGNQAEAGDSATEGFLSDEELDELEADLPALAKVIRAQQAQLTAMASRVAELTNSRIAERDAENAKAWNEALEQNPKAKYLDATLAPEVGQRFINAASALYDNWDAMSLAERVAAIVRQYEAVHGEIKIATTSSSSTKHSAQTQNVPLSMSGIPGGSAPPVDEAAALLSKSGVELTQTFMQMTPEQIDAQLNRLI